MKKALFTLFAFVLICGTVNAADWGLNFNFSHPNFWIGPPPVPAPPVVPVPPSGYYYYYPQPSPFSFYYRERDNRGRDRGCRPSRPKYNPPDCAPHRKGDNKFGRM